MIDVCRPYGQIVRALTYTVKNPQPGLKTNVEYVRHVICRLREHGALDEYIANVKAIAVANNPNITADDNL